MRTRNQSGFGGVEMLLVVIVVALIGALGLVFYNRNNALIANNGGQSPVASDVQSAPEIQSASDLEKAEAVLDQTDPSASEVDASQLDALSAEF